MFASAALQAIVSKSQQLFSISICTTLIAVGFTVSTGQPVRAVALSTNSNDLVVTFTGVTSLPATQTFLNPVNLKVAWTLNGATPADADFIYMTTPGSAVTPAYYTVQAPTSGTGPSGSVVAKTVTATDVVTMTVRAVDGTSNLAGYLGGQAAVGQRTATNFAMHDANASNASAKELVSFGNFTNFWTLSDAFAKVTSTFVLDNVQLPATVTDLSYTFGNTGAATSFNGAAVGSWDTSHVTNLKGTFQGNTLFNQSLNGWDTSNVTTLESTFSGATVFNNGLASGTSGTWSTWTTTNLTSLNQTFSGASAFNQNINSWDTSKVTTMFCTFSSAYAFNQPLTNWDTSNVTTLAQMFNQAWVFNNGLASGIAGSQPWIWNTSKVTDTSYMFQGSSLAGRSAFNQNINSWDVSKVTNMSSMFFRAYKFNQPLNNWVTSSVTNMSSLFAGTLLFNQPLSNWDTSNVTNMNAMFNGAAAFNQDISNFATLRVTNMSSMFSGATIFNNGLAAGASGTLSWNTNSVTNYSSIFLNATSMNLSLASFNVNNAAGNGTTASTFIEFPSSMDSANVQKTLISWSQENIPTSSLTYIKLNGQNFYSDCASYTAYLKLTTAPAAVSFAGSGVAPTAPTCSSQTTSASLTWTPTTAITAPTFSTTTKIYTFTPQAATSSGPAFQYVSRTAGCSVNPSTGLVTYAYTFPSPPGSTSAGSNPGTCVLRVIETTSTGALNYLDVTFTLYRYTVPASPTAITLTSGTSSVLVGWTAPTDFGRSAITGYTVTTSPGSFTCSGASTDTSCTVSGLTSGTSYTFSVTATNAIGTSVAATKVAVPGAPTISGITVGNATLTISFTAGSNFGSAITRYEYTTDNWTSFKSFSPSIPTSPVSITTISSSATSLVNGTSYQIGIRAVSASGNGVPSNVVSASPDVPPNAPTLGTIVAGNNSLSVPFTAPSPTTPTGSSISNYEYSTDGGTTWLARSPASISSPLVIRTLSDGSGSTLVNGTSYSIKLRAFNSTAGAASTAQSATPQAPPGPVSNISGTPGDSQVALTWDAPTGTVTNYIVEYSTNNVSFTTFTHSVSNANSMTVTGLTNGIAYVFRISGVNSVGTGSNVTSSYYTPEVAPNAPTLGTIVAGNNSLSVPFTAPSPTTPAGSSITNYEFSTDGGATWLTRSPASTSSPLTIGVSSDGSSTPLVNGTTYSIKLRAVNTLVGAASLAQTATPVSPPGAVTNISGTAGNAQVALTWTAPSEGTVTDYNIEFSADGTTFTEFSHSPSSATSATVTGLTNGTTYVFRISALNGVVVGSSAQSASFTPRATQATLTISSSTTVPYLSTLTLTTSGGSGNGSVYFTALSGSTCSVIGNVLVPGNAGSSCRIMATKLGDSTYTSKDSANVSITVTKIDQADTLTLANSSTITYGQSFSLNAIGGSGTGAYFYSVTSPGTTGCSVDATTGVLTTTGSGTCDVQAKRLTSTNYLETDPAKVATQSITVNTASQSISFSSSIPINPLSGGTYTPTASATSSLPLTFTTASAHCSISGGVVTFGSSGVCTIYADQAGNNKYSAAPTQTQTITIGKRNQTLEFEAGTLAITQVPFDSPVFGVEGHSSESTAVVTFSGNSATTNNACTVSSAGVVTIRAVGICAIQANAAGNQVYADASSIVHSFEVVPVVTTTPFITSISAGNKAITASFTEPSYLGGSLVSGYQLVAVAQDGTSPSVTESGCSAVLVSGEATCTVHGLIDGVTYRVKVAAVNAAGTGPFTDLSSGLLVASNPEAVQQLHVSQQNAQLVIHWEDPDSLGGGVFVAYRIFIKLASRADFDSSYYEVTDPTEHSLTATHTSGGGTVLQNGTAYDVKVVTVTAANARELTANVALANQIPRTVPGVPRYSDALIDGNLLVITWQIPLTDGGAAISSYTARVDSQTCVFAQSLDTFCSVTSPSASGSIRYSIAANNVAGTGNAATGSDDVVIPGTTPSSTPSPASSPKHSSKPQDSNVALPAVSVSAEPSELPSQNAVAQPSSSPSDSENLGKGAHPSGNGHYLKSIATNFAKYFWWLLLLLLIIPIRRAQKEYRKKRQH